MGSSKQGNPNQGGMVRDLFRCAGAIAALLDLIGQFENVSHSRGPHPALSAGAWGQQGDLVLALERGLRVLVREDPRGWMASW